jgi:PAS domain S-box-containing protein
MDICSDNNENREIDLSFYRTMIQTLIDQATVGIYLIEDGAHLYVNTYYSNLFGYAQQDFIQGLVPIHKIVHPDDFPFVQSFMEKRTSGEKKDDHHNIRSIRKDGTILYTEIHSTVKEIDGRKLR